MRLVEVLAALSLGTDLGMGQPLGHAVRTCLVATGLGAELGLSVSQRVDIVYVGLLRYLGCTSDAFEVSRFAGDEIALARTVAPYVMGDPGDEERATGMVGVDRAKGPAIAAHCEAAALLASRLQLGEGVIAGLRHGFERWDGTGHPGRLAGAAIPVAARIAVPARDVELWSHRGGFATALNMARSRRGRAYDPTVVDVFADVGERLLRETAGTNGVEAVFDVDPVAARVPARRLDSFLEVFADFADAKLPQALGHSRMVARLAERAARELRVDDTAAGQVRRAGLVHDLGRAGVSTMIWAKPGPLTLEERERVRLHPFLSERVLSRSAPLRPLATMAGAHHERLDGSGYYRGVGGPDLGTLHRLLAAADSYAAMRQARPYRPGLDARAAGVELAREARADRLDARAVSAVLAASGQGHPGPPIRWPAGLTDREVDVLRLACRGATRQAVAGQLRISAKTVSRHLENSYAKIGVTTRAAAALYAVEHGLLDRPTMG